MWDQTISFSTFEWVQEIELRSPDLHSKRLYHFSHLIILLLFFLLFFYSSCFFLLFLFFLFLLLFLSCCCLSPAPLPHYHHTPPHHHHLSESLTGCIVKFTEGWLIFSISSDVNSSRWGACGNFMLWPWVCLFSKFFFFLIRLFWVYVLSLCFVYQNKSIPHFLEYWGMVIRPCSLMN